jgi:hypothetical protein
MYKRFTDRARRVVRTAHQEAQRFNHDYVGTEHILLGLVKEGDGVAVQILRGFNTDLRQIRVEVEKRLAAGPDLVAMGKLPLTSQAKNVIQYSIEEAHNFTSRLSDVMCPWCYAGKRRLEKAVAALGGPVKVRWLPPQLNPAMPKEGVSRREYRTKKFGSWERPQELDARVVAVGEAEGIPLPSAASGGPRTPSPTRSFGWPGGRACRVRSWGRCSGPTSRGAGTSATVRRSSTWLPGLASAGTVPRPC